MDRIWSGACIGNFFLEKFDPENMIFLKWLNCFEYLLEYSKTENGDKSKYLLQMVEDTVFNEIEEHVYPSNPYDLSYKELISVLEKRFSCFHGEIAANFRYAWRNQLPNESVDHYLISLRKLLNKCTSNVKRLTNLKNQFIKGLANKKTRTLLKKEGDLSFGMTLSIAKEMELSKKYQTKESSFK